MIKLLKILLPSFIPLLVFSFIAKHYTQVDGSSGAVMDNMIFYYHHMMPVWFVIAVLIQYLIVIPLWNKALAGNITRKFVLIVVLVLVCVAIATGIGYTIWDSSTGTNWLFNAILIITGIQLAYWLVNLLILTLLSAFQNKKPQAEAVDG
jgi:hypothetical protein